MNQQNNSLSVPIAIVIAGALVAFGIFWTGRGTAAPAPAKTVQQASLNGIQSIQPDDHVLGSRNAKVVVVEYSDTECPYCKVFHTTMHQLVTSYNGQVAWVFRYFPVHQKSINEGEAQECAAELGGNTAFWNFTDKVFETTNSNDSLDPASLPTIATSIGLDAAKFSTCLLSNKYESKITADRDEVTGAGAEGTPFTVIFAAGRKIPITQGALPYDAMKNVLDTILKNS